MSKRIEIRKILTEEQCFERLEVIPEMQRDLKTIIVILEGRPEDGKKGIMGHVQETNGKVKWHSRMLYGIWGALGVIIIMFIEHLNNVR